MGIRPEHIPNLIIAISLFITISCLAIVLVYLVALNNLLGR